MNNFLKRTWAEIDLDALKSNFLEIKKKVGNNAKIMCVVKADAYGHGVKNIIREYQILGADWYAVSNLAEAIEIRNAGATKPILILGYTPVEMVETLQNYNISQAILSEEYAQKLILECRKKNACIKCHIKVDTGMSRIGFSAQSHDEIQNSIKSILTLNQNKELNIEGIFTHFSVSDDLSQGVEYTKMQFNNFKSVVDGLEKSGMTIPLKHCCNSGGIIEYPYMYMDMVRAGIILYGLSPSVELSGKLNLTPVMKLKTVVSQLKTIKKGTCVSYGRTFVAQNDMKIATVPIGYADGYSRDFSNKAEMTVCGKRAKIVGRVCMDQLMLDVTGIDGVEEGTIVTVFGDGSDNTVTVDELASISNTINYEIVCLIGKRVPRIYLKDNKEVAIFSLI